LCSRVPLPVAIRNATQPTRGSVEERVLCMAEAQRARRQHGRLSGPVLAFQRSCAMLTSLQRRRISGWVPGVRKDAQVVHAQSHRPIIKPMQLPSLRGPDCPMHDCGYVVTKARVLSLKQNTVVRSTQHAHTRRTADRGQGEVSHGRRSFDQQLTRQPAWRRCRALIRIACSPPTERLAASIWITAAPARPRSLRR